MKIYHGSNVVVREPKVLASDRKLDFGTGFYLTSSYEQAERWAELTAKRKDSGAPVVSVFEFDDSGLESLKCLKFEKADKTWLQFVARNRKDPDFENDYDFIVGPVANDRTMPVISLFFAKIYDEEETIKRLLPQKLCDQFVFRTEKSLLRLKFVEAITHG